MIYFTADTHFAHNNIIQYCNRPFANILEHDEALIKNWNSVVTNEDTIYHLGDFGWDGKPKIIAAILERLHGKIHLIKGNHDRGKITKKEPFISRFISIEDVLCLTPQYAGKTYNLFLSHYPHRSWKGSFRGAIHCFGHVHGKMGPHGLSFDVGVDVWNYTPISLVQVIEKAEELKKGWTPEISL